MEQQPSVVHATFAVERSFNKPVETVFQALSDPSIKSRWYATGENHDVEHYDLDFRVGGIERTLWRFSENSPFPGVILTNEGVFHDIVPNRRIVNAYTMTIGDHRMSSSLATFELLPTANGTDLIFTHQGAFFEGSDGPERREAGWRKLIDRLAAALGE